MEWSVKNYSGSKRSGPDLPHNLVYKVQIIIPLPYLFSNLRLQCVLLHRDNKTISFFAMFATADLICPETIIPSHKFLKLEYFRINLIIFH